MIFFSLLNAKINIYACFQSKTYDSVTDKFMDFSFEKTNSAYMLFYEWSGQGEQCSSAGSVDEPATQQEQGQSAAAASQPSTQVAVAARATSPHVQFELSKELEDWIWYDNRTFLRDKNIFEHHYFK